MAARVINHPQISVVVPIFSETRDLANLYSWIFSEPAKDLEIILVIDSPFGKMSKGVEDLLHKAINRKIQLINVQYGSPGMSRSIGIKQSKGEWICFWDCDDIPNIIEFKNMINGASIRNSTIAIGDFEIVTREKTILKKFRHPIQSRKSFFSQLALAPGMWRFAFNRNVISQIEFPMFRMGEDQSFLAESLNSEQSPYFYGASVYQYFSGTSSQLTNNPDAISELGKSLRNIELLKKKGVSVDILIPMYLTQSWTLIKHSKWSKRFGLTMSAVSFLGFRIDILLSLVSNFIQIHRRDQKAPKYS